MRGYLYPPAYVLSPVRRTTTTDSLALAARAANYSTSNPHNYKSQPQPETNP